MTSQMASSNAKSRAPILTTYAAFVFAFIYLPIVVLIAYSFNRDGVGGFPPRHFTHGLVSATFRRQRHLGCGVK